MTQHDHSFDERDNQLLKKRALQVQRGAARAAVLGVNDGLVSTLSIVLAVAAAGSSPAGVRLAGFAGLIAGAISMAIGEWISVTSQVDLFRGILKDLRRMVRYDRPLLREQLADNLVSAGISPATAARAASEISSDEKHLHTVYASRVMGINPEELGSPWVAAFSSFMLFTVGSLAALLPWFFTSGYPAITLSVIFTGLGGLLVGGYVASSGGHRVIPGALRQLAVIVLAAGVTYGVGYLFGTTIR